jgi:hypothetical protein
MSSSSIRATAFGGHASIRLAQALNAKPRRLPLEVWLYASACMVLMMLMAGAMWKLEATHKFLPEHNAAIASAGNLVELPLPAEKWKALSISDKAPAIVRELESAGLPLQYRDRLPVAKLDGEAMGGKLPSTIWLKLDQPGNTMLVVETDQGVFVKALEDVAPGFASPCKLDAYSFGTPRGEPAYFDRDSTIVKALWVVQDASAEPGRTPGWIALTPPEEKKIAPQNDDENLTTL